MAEDWAPEEMTEEEEAAYEKEQNEASEEEPPELDLQAHEDKDDPPQIDRSTISERLGMEEKPAAEDEKPPEGEKKPSGPAAPEKWMESLSDEAKMHINGLRSEIAKTRERVREERDDSEKRFLRMEETVANRIADLSKPPGPDKPTAPDPDVDPDGFRKFFEDEAEASKQELAQFRDQALEQDEYNNLVQSVANKEAAFRVEHPDYDVTITAVKMAAGKLKTAQLVNAGHTQRDASILGPQQIEDQLVSKARELEKSGGNFAQWLYNEAQQLAAKQPPAQTLATEEALQAPAQTQAEKTAATIAAGQRASKSLGKGGKGTVGGDLTLDEISAIADPEEHDKEYAKWEARMTGKSDNWTSL